MRSYRHKPKKGSKKYPCRKRNFTFYIVFEILNFCNSAPKSETCTMSRRSHLQAYDIIFTSRVRVCLLLDNRIIAQSMLHSSLPHTVFPQGELFMAFQAILAYLGRLRTIPCGGQLHFEHIESILVALKRGDLTSSYYKEWKQTSLNHKLKSPYYIVTGTFQQGPFESHTLT